MIKAFGLPDRTCAMELDLSVLFAAAEGRGTVQAPQLSAYPPATQDVALIVDAAVPAAEVEAALVAGAPQDLLEDVRLFDVYTGAQVGEDAQVPGLHAQVPCPRPDAHRGGDHGRPRRGRRRGQPPGRRRPARRLSALAIGSRAAAIHDSRRGFLLSVPFG